MRATAISCTQSAPAKFAFLQAVPEDTAEAWAKFLVEEVYLNLAGFPAVLRTDRGRAPLGEVVAAVNRWLGVTHAFGSSYHPQSQHIVEGQHQRPNRILKAFVEGNPGRWARFVAVAQWALRATPRGDLGGLSPFELLTGLRPQRRYSRRLLRRCWTRRATWPTCRSACWD